MAKYFKVLSTRNDGVFVSIVAQGAAEVEYRQGIETRAPFWLANRGYGICVFATLYDASLFTTIGYNGYTAWECECEGPITPLPPKLDGEYLFRGDEGYMDAVVLAADRRWPKGTLMFKSVTPLRRVDL